MFLVQFHKNGKHASQFDLQQIIHVTLHFAVEPIWVDFWAWTEPFVYLELAFLLFYWQHSHFLLIHHYQLPDISVEE